MTCLRLIIYQSQTQHKTYEDISEGNNERCFMCYTVKQMRRCQILVLKGNSTYFKHKKCV